MGYFEIQPHPALKHYIDAYWISEITENALHKTKILPDGCVDISNPKHLYLQAMVLKHSITSLMNVHFSHQIRYKF